MTHKMALHALLGDYRNTAALKKGVVSSPLLDVKFADVKPVSSGFKRLVREKEFDFGELAIVTYLQARSFGVPYSLLPITVVGRSHHHAIAYNPEKGLLRPHDLNGKRVGVRSYSVTTTTWVRAILARDFGVDLDSIEWVTFEDPHVAEYRDPPNATRAPAGRNIAEMLLDGELDAAVVGDKLPDSRLKNLIPEPESAASAWTAQNGGIPINHMAVVRNTLVKSRPDIVKEIYQLMLASKRAAEPTATNDDDDSLRFGVEQNRRMLEMIIAISHEQKLIPRRFTVDELFEDTQQILEL